MSTFIIRSQGFFYTDEYFAPGEVFKQVVKKTYPTKQAATKACAVLVRKWVRSEPIGNYVFDDRKVTAAVTKYLRAEWPGKFDKIDGLYEVQIPRTATDKQVDEVVALMEVTFAQVFKVEDGSTIDDDDDDDDADGEDADDGDLYFGPKR